ncbi:MAG: 4Fe-4S dicluster domain-containing protein [Myxococcales bacterium]|nr:4Fe-4S dicluster domain-containing protein [Myxococcales bacterium]
MSDDEPLSKREVLSRGLLRLRNAGAQAAEAAIDRVADRLTPQVQRPPGALVETSFLVACTRCGECVKACPVDAIQLLDGNAGVAAGTPFLDVNARKPCVVCEDAPCMPACPSGALRVIDMRDAVMGTATIDRNRCRPWTGGGTCDRCVKACPFVGDAILADEQGRPYIDPRHCIGCGVCRAACPTFPKSIRVDPPPRF